MKRGILLILGVGMVAYAPGCTPPAAPGSDEGLDSPVAGDDSSTGDDTGEGSNDDTSGEPAASASISGLVLDPDGQPTEGVRVTLCHGVCRFADTGADGAFAYSEVEPGSYALHFTLLGENRGWADLLVVVELADDEDRVVATPFPMAELGAATEVTSTREVEVADGLWLTVDPSAVDLPFGADTLDVAAAVPDSFPPELPADDILAVWYLDPFDAQVEPGMTLRATNTWGLAPGDQAVLWTSSYLDYAWVEAGTVTVSDDGSEVVGGDIPVISTLVLARSGG